MKRKNMGLMALVAALILAVVFFYRTNPERHARMFVDMYADQIENSLKIDGAVPNNLGCLEIFFWDGEDPVIEFTLSGWGIGSDMRYYGCYYSYNDAPVPFQNTDVPLQEKGTESWTWQGDGDNHGITHKLKDHWYYFEASF